MHHIFLLSVHLKSGFYHFIGFLCISALSSFFHQCGNIGHQLLIFDSSLRNFLRWRVLMPFNSNSSKLHSKGSLFNFFDLFKLFWMIREILDILNLILSIHFFFDSQWYLSIFILLLNFSLNFLNFRVHLFDGRFFIIYL